MYSHIHMHIHNHTHKKYVARMGHIHSPGRFGLLFRSSMLMMLAAASPFCPCCRKWWVGACVVVFFVGLDVVERVSSAVSVVGVVACACAP